MRAQVAIRLAALVSLIAGWSLIGGVVHGGTPEQQFSLAAGHYGRGRWELARAEFGELLGESPQHRLAEDARFYRAECASQLRDYGAARVEFGEYLRLAPTSRHASRAEFRIAEASYLLGDGDRAARELSAFVQARAEDSLAPHAQGYLGQLELARGRHEEARRAFEEALRRAQTGDSAIGWRLGLAVSLERLAEPAEARRWYELVARQPHASSAEAALRLALLDRREGRSAEAKERLRELAGRDDSPLATAAGYWLARTCLDTGDTEGAQEAVSRTLAKLVESPAVEPRVVAIRVLLAESSMRRGDFEDACDELEGVAGALDGNGATTKDSSAGLLPETRDSQLWYLLTLAQLGAGRPADALAASEQVRPEQLDESRQLQWLAAHGQCLFATGRFAEAIGPLREQLSGQAATLPPLESLAEDASEQAVVDAAREPIATQASSDVAGAPERDDGRALLRSQLAIALAATGQFDAAVESLDGPGASHGSRRAAREYVAAQAAAAGRHELAANLLRDVSQQEPMPRAETLARQLRFECAALPAERLDTALSGRRDAVAETAARLRECCGDSAEGLAALLLHAECSERWGDEDTALAGYTWLSERPGASQAAAWLGLARLCERTGRDEDALRALEELQKVDPQRADSEAALYHRAWALADLGRDDEAQSVFRRLAERYPTGKLGADAAYRVALSELRAGRYAEAAARLRPLCERGGESPGDAPFWLAEALFRQQAFDDASTWLEACATALETNPAPAWAPLCLLRRAQIAAHREQWGDALRLLEQLPTDETFASRAEADFTLGRCLAAKARFQEARDAYTRVVDSPRRDPELAARAQWMIGETFLHQRRYNEAIRAFHRVELEHPIPRWQSLALLQVGKCHEALGEWVQAAATYEQLVDELPEADAEATAEATRRRVEARRRAESK